MGPEAGGKSRRPAGAHIWDTRDVGAREAFAYYSDAMCAAFSPVVPQVAAERRRNFVARIESRAAGSGCINRVETVTHGLVRTAREIAAGTDDWLYLFYDPRGRCCVVQNEVEVAARQGDIVLFSGTRPFKLVHAGEPSLSVITLLVPDAAFRRGPGDDGLLRPRVVSDHPVFGSLIREAMRVFARHPEQLSPDAGSALFASTIELARLACGAVPDRGASAESRSRTLYLVIAGLIDRNFRDPRLGAARIAAAHGISSRYVHKLFERHGSGQTLTEYLLARRLSWAAERLSGLEYSDIVDTAFAAGFSDLTHFYRAFRRRYGTAPGQFRAMRKAAP